MLEVPLQPDVDACCGRIVEDTLHPTAAVNWNIVVPPGFNEDGIAGKLMRSFGNTGRCRASIITADGIRGRKSLLRNSVWPTSAR